MDGNEASKVEQAFANLPASTAAHFRIAVLFWELPGCTNSCCTKASVVQDSVCAPLWLMTGHCVWKVLHCLCPASASFEKVSVRQAAAKLSAEGSFVHAGLTRLRCCCCRALCLSGMDKVGGAGVCEGLQA